MHLFRSLSLYLIFSFSVSHSTQSPMLFWSLKSLSRKSFNRSRPVVTEMSTANRANSSCSLLHTTLSRSDFLLYVLKNSIILKKHYFETRQQYVLSSLCIFLSFFLAGCCFVLAIYLSPPPSHICRPHVLCQCWYFSMCALRTYHGQENIWTLNESFSTIQKQGYRVFGKQPLW